MIRDTRSGGPEAGNEKRKRPLSTRVKIDELTPAVYRPAIAHDENGSVADSIFSCVTTDIRTLLSPGTETPEPRMIVDRRDPRLEAVGFYVRSEGSTRLEQGHFFTRERTEVLAPLGSPISSARIRASGTSV